jgi:alginate O-acetyltransferase complex protein AlgI
MMDFVTPEYYFWFLPLVFLCTFVIGFRKRRRQIGILLASSYLFFCLASGWHIILLLISTIVDWTSANKIAFSDRKSTKTKWLRFSLITNLGILATFKYLDFFIESWNWTSLKLTGTPELDTLGVALPVGISFYTFQTMSYTIDVYRNKNQPYDDFLSFACYAAFFPQLVAGPIVRADHFKAQISTVLQPSSAKFRLGTTLIIYGLAKKLIVADNVALHVNTIFENSSGLENIGVVWWGAFAFGIQIYCDFSAYTDIAIGSSHLLGVELPENFDSPYAATSPQDFWRRWHISLSTWLRDYLYIPLGGSRNGYKTMLWALMVTMLLGGLWHGASWNFVLWGLMHGVLLIAHRGLIKLKVIGTLFDKIPRLSKITGWMITQYLIFLTWLVFRLENTSVLFQSMKTYIGIDGYWNQKEFMEVLPEIKYLTFAIAIIFVMGHFLSWKVGGLKYWIARQNSIIWGVIIGSMLTLALFLRPAETVDFIYFRF